MTLRTRLLLLVQGVLALALAGFSTSLYLLASKHLHGQADERLEAALNTLAAATEVDSDGLEWEPEERSLSFGRRAVEGGFLWRVADDQGRTIDGSAAGPILHGAEAPRSHPRRPMTFEDDSGRPWRVLHRRLEAATPRAQDPKDDDDDPPKSYPALQFSAAVAIDGTQATLGRLALTLIGLSTALWVATLAVGGQLCRRALQPLSAMAEAAHGIGGQEPGARLPAPETGDELEDLGLSFNALLDRLQGSFDRQRRFTGDASHQLRTPLTAILGNVDLTLRQKRSPEEYEQALGLIGRKARRMRAIIEALLFLARADAAAPSGEPERIDLDRWLASFLEARRDAPRSDDVELEIGPGGPFVATVVVTPLGELLENLLENAGKYSDPGSPIVVRLERLGPNVAIQVSDRGIGIDEADLPHLFEPFHRSQAALDRGAPGVGLGLSIADRLARSLGLTIEASNRPGGGSTFAVRFPNEPHG